MGPGRRQRLGLGFGFGLGLGLGSGSGEGYRQLAEERGDDVRHHVRDVGLQEVAGDMGRRRGV